RNGLAGRHYHATLTPASSTPPEIQPPRTAISNGNASSLQPIPAALRQQQARIRRIRLDLLAQAIDVRLQRVRGDVGVVAPHLRQQLLAPDRFAARAIEILQDIRFLLGETDLLL